MLRRSNFRHQASSRVSPRESTQRRKVKLWARNVRKFCLNADLHVTFRDLLHAVMLRHGTDVFTSPPKEGVLRIFCPKNPTASAGCEPANLGTKGQYATSRPSKPLKNWLSILIISRYIFIFDDKRHGNIKEHFSIPIVGAYKLWFPSTVEIPLVFGHKCSRSGR
jgi:hypothetical protein